MDKLNGTDEKLSTTTMGLNDEDKDKVQFDFSCIDYIKYPLNYRRPDVSQKKLRNYAKQLYDLSDDLFSDDPRLGFWDLNYGSNDFELKRCQSLEEVQRLCSWSKPRHVRDPQDVIACRFIFLHSENARCPLYTTREMLMLALSYHTVIPWFLDFLFMFGQQDSPRDFRFSAFRHKLYDISDPASELSHLGRTNHQLHICYNLKWPEETATTKYRPWSMRQTVVYSIFDIGRGTVFFIILKGNDSMSKALREETSRLKWHGSDSDTRKLNSFVSYLRTNLFVCESSCETWRSYINYLEYRLNELTEDAIIHRVTKKPLPKMESTQLQETPQHRWTRGWISMKRIMSDVKNMRSTLKRESEYSNDMSQAEKAWNNDVPLSKPTVQTARPTPDVQFSKLQEATKMDEKVKEALLALESDIKIMKSLSEQYDDLGLSSVSLEVEATKFTSQIKEMIQDLHMYRSSLDNLSRIFAERRNLVAAILQHRNVEASEIFAAEAQLASQRMETMTEDMRVLAQKTKRETLSMSVIAGVTMFFLPGTFVSTFMSTPIVTWNAQEDGTFRRHTESGAINLFLELTLPLTAATFAAWMFLTWRYNSRDLNSTRT